MRKTIIGVSILAVLIGVACLFPKAEAAPEVKRYGSVIGLKADKIDYYKKLHAETWPEVLKMIEDCNIRNYSIYHKDNLLFAYFEYVGDDFDGDMAKMAADPETQRWWDIMEPMQAPLATRAAGEWWANLDEVFHTD